MNTNSMQHNKSVLFIISLSQNKIHEIEEKRVDYQLFLRTIRSYSHVEVHETINEKLISTASSFKVVVIVGHQVDGFIEMPDGSQFPMEKIADALPIHYNGYIHVAVCDSDAIRSAIKDRCPECRLRTAPEATELELPLLIYFRLLGHRDLSKETFDNWYDSERETIKQIQESKDPAELAKLPIATKLGEENVKTSVYSPYYVSRGEYFSIFVAMHFDADNGTLFINQRRNDPSLRDEEAREHNVVLNNVHYGDELSIKISFEDATKYPTDLIWVNSDDNPQSVTISDKIVPLEFDVFVDAGYPYDYFKAILEYIKDGRCLKKFDYHKYEFKSVYHPQYNHNSSHVGTGANKDYRTREAEQVTHKPIERQQQRGPTENDGETTKHTKNKKERLIYAMQKVVEENLIKKKRDWAAIYKILNEKLDAEKKEKMYTLKISDLLEYMKHLEYNRKIIPKENSNVIEKFYYCFSLDETHEHPDWKIDSITDAERERLIGLATKFKEYFEEG